MDLGASLALLAASVAGSVHCVGMCGGLMLSATGSRLQHQFVYHGFRFLGYLSMGALAGMAGEHLFREWQWLPLQIFFAAMVLIVLVLAALNSIFNWKLLSRFSQMGIGWGYRVGGGVGSGAGVAGDRVRGGYRVGAENSLLRPALIGFFTVFLPCGWLYSFILLSLATHSLLAGAMTLTVFWLGTLPALMGSRILLQGLFARFGVKGARIVSAIMILAAMASVAGHFRGGIHRATNSSAGSGGNSTAHCN